MNPNEYCRQIYAKSGSSFKLAFLFLPAARRQALTAFYAFCREVDDIVDECNDLSVATLKIGWWRDEIARLYQGLPTHPVTQALLAGVDTYDLPQEMFMEILDGMQMDLSYNRYPDFKSLQLYCYRVAGVVGHISALIFGVSDRQTLKYAHDLGLALQLTNIVRDVGDDARRGRIYLPSEDLAHFKVSEEEILDKVVSERFTQLMKFEIDRAETCYQSAWKNLPAVDRRAQRPGLVMGDIYYALLHVIAEKPEMVLTHRISVPPGRKLILAIRAWLRFR